MTRLAQGGSQSVLDCLDKPVLSHGMLSLLLASSLGFQLVCAEVLQIRLSS